MPHQHSSRTRPSVSCALLQGGIGTAIWLLVCAVDPLLPITGTSALQAAAGFLILVACGAPGALGISLVHALLLASSLPSLPLSAILLHAAAPGVGAYLGVATMQSLLGIGRRLAGLRQSQIPLLVLAATLSTASLHGTAACATRQCIGGAMLLQRVLTNFTVTMLVMVTMLITIRAMRGLAALR